MAPAAAAAALVVACSDEDIGRKADVDDEGGQSGESTDEEGCEGTRLENKR